MRFLKALVLLSVILSICLPAEAQLSFGGQPMQPPDVQAWVVDEMVQLDETGAGSLRIAVEVPPDHHGYLDKGEEGFFIPIALTFTPFTEHGARVVEVLRPQGEQDDKVQATVLRGEGEFVFRLENTGALPAEPLTATLQSQICNDVTNICYPPRKLNIPVRLATATTATSVIAPPSQVLPLEPTGPLTIRERTAALFRQYRGNLGLALGLVFLAGLIAAATPCVYPVIPITAAILAARGEGSRQRGRWHAIVYFLGLIFFYTLLGVVAVTTGTALSTIMTSAWVNLAFAALFVYLGLSMLGVYEFQFMPALTAKLDAASGRWSGFSGTFFMGATAGLIVSPCVGPVVGAILLEITGSAAEVSAAGAGTPTHLIVRGLVLMTGFGAGLGIPFLVVGLLSNRLPQSGTWLTKVKFILGIPILYFAYTYYLKGMETAGVPANISHAILIGIVAIAGAVFIGAFHHLGEQPQRGLLLRRACGIILLVVGVHFLYNGLGRSGILLTATMEGQGGGAGLAAASSAPSRQDAVEVHGNLSWLRDFDLAQQRASTEQKPLFIDFYATWCANCKAFGKLAVRNPQLNTALQEAVLVKIYDTDAVFKTFQQDRRFPELVGVGGQPFLPLFAVYSPQGELLWKGQDYKAVRTMVAQLERAVTP